MRILFLLLSLICINTLDAQMITQLGHNNTSYQFYSEDITPVKEEQIKLKPTKKDPYPYTTKMETIKKEMTEAQDRYLLNPTQENTILLQKAIISVYAMGQRAAMARMQMLTMNPTLSYRAKNPTESNARMIANEETLNKERQAVRSLAKTHALLFFYDGDDGKALALAPDLLKFAKRYGFIFKGVPITNQTISSIKDNYLDVAHNKSVAKSMDITVFPSLVLLNAKTGQFQPVFYGFASITEIMQMMAIIQSNFDYKAFFHD